MRIKLVTPPAEEPVTLGEAKSHLRVDIDDDDTYIGGLITAAREYIEGVTRRAFVTQTLKLSLDEWPCGNEIELPRAPLVSVSSVVYKDSEGSATTWPSSAYIVDADGEPGRVVLAYGEIWPSVTLYPASPIQITFVAGYGGAANVPQTLKQLILLLVGHWYENREPVGGPDKQIPLAVDSGIYHNRMY